MTILQMISTLLLGPLEMFFDVVFAIANRYIQNAGLSIAVLSLVINVLIFPLYDRADALQEKERAKERAMAPRIAQIKKAFHGDERFFILQTYYRQMHYRPTDGLKGSVSLLLEIPFFLAAYSFLSGLRILQGASFGPIADLGAPDALLAFGGVTLHLLPILMTVINLASALLYSKGLSLRSKVQLFGLPLLFLWLLYDSPSGLVLYWTLNNVFSLLKNIWYRIHPRKEAVLAQDNSAQKRDLLFPAAALFLTLLLGLFLPAQLLASSPAEFARTAVDTSPVWFVVRALLLAAGSFLFWAGVFYGLSGEKGRQRMRVLFAAAGVGALLNVMVFSQAFGNLSATLVYDTPPFWNFLPMLGNALVMIAVLVLFWFLHRKFAKFLPTAFLIGSVSLGVLGIFSWNTSSEILAATPSASCPPAVEELTLPLSRNKKNVVVLMLDRAISGYFPYLMEEKPELKEAFSGFTYFDNTTSFGGFTNVGTPPLFGGYEYTPEEMNARDNMSLKDKQNEALRVMPVLFDRAGFDVTVADPPYADYTYFGNPEIFPDYPDIRSFHLRGRFMETSSEKLQKEANERNFFRYSVYKAAPLLLQPVLYASGTYNHADTLTASGAQIVTSAYTARGLGRDFQENYTTLMRYPDITRVNDMGPGSFLMLDNDTAHDINLLQLPEYVPMPVVDNRAFEASHPAHADGAGNEIRLDTTSQQMHYQVNMAAMLGIGRWLNHLKEEGVYDNTRIIIVSDHGRSIAQFPNRRLSDPTGQVPLEALDTELYQSLLLVKDFGASGPVATSNEFMTVADVPQLVTEGVVPDARNPFTGNPLAQPERKEMPQRLLYTTWQITVNNGNRFLPGTWLTVQKNLHDLRNWTVEGEEK